MSAEEVWITSDRKDGARLHGWLFLPAGAQRDATKPLPLVVGAHGITCLVAHGLHDYGRAFTESGFASLMFDYAGWGESEGQPRDIVDVHAQQRGYQTVLAWARKQKEFDPEKIVLFGSSYSGGHSVIVGAKDKDLAGIMIANPFSSGISSCLAITSIWTIPLLVLAHVDFFLGLLSGNRIPPIYVPITAPYDPQTGRTKWWVPAALTAGDTPQGFYEMKQKYAKQGEVSQPNRASVRSMVQVPFFSPVSHAKDVKCPLLVVIPRGKDYLCPTRDAKLIAQRAPRGKLVEVGTTRSGHFSFYPGVTNNNCSQEAMATMKDFLKEIAGR